MKANLSFIKKISNFCQDLTDVAKVQADVGEVIDDMKQLTKEGDESKAFNFSERNRSYLRRLNKKLTNFGEMVEDAKVRSSDIAASIPTQFTKLHRKCKILAKNFADVKELFEEVQDKVKEAQVAAANDASIPQVASINPDSPNLESKSDKMSVPASVTPPSEDVIDDPDAGKLNIPQSVNFSKMSYSKSLIDEISRRYTAFAESLVDAGDQMEDVADATNEVIDEEISKDQPKEDDEEVEEVKTENGEAPVEELTSVEVEDKEPVAEEEVTEDKEVTEEGEDKEFCGDQVQFGGGILRDIADNIDSLKSTAGKAAKLTPMAAMPLASGIMKFFSEEEAKDGVTVEEVQSKIIEEGVKALNGDSEYTKEDIADAVEDLEKAVPGAGEAALQTIENFSVIYNRCFSKNFSVEVVEEAKEVLKDALNKIHDNEVLDVDELSNKLEGIKEANPGVYEVVVEVVNDEAERNTPAVVKALANFSEGLQDIKEFVSDVPVANKDVKSDLCGCVKELDCAVAKIMGSKNLDFSEFINSMDKLRNFTVEGPDAEIVEGVKSDVTALADDVVGALEDQYNAGIAITPSQSIIESDKEINDLVDEIREKANLPAEIKSFSTIMCDSIKSIKCFSVSDIDNKLRLLEQFAEVTDPEKDEEAEPEEIIDEADEPKEAEPNMDVAPEDEEAEAVVPGVTDESEVAEEVKEETVCPECHKDPCECESAEVTETEEIEAPSDDEVAIKNFSVKKSSTDAYGDFIFSIM